MKKIITVIVVLIIIAGLGFGGFWVYKKMNISISSELEKVEINPDDRKELIENLGTTEDKINMIIQLIEDINYKRVNYYDEFFGSYHVKDKYEIKSNITSGFAVVGYDYMNKMYVAGTGRSGMMWVTGSSSVYHWDELKKQAIVTSNEKYTVVNLNFEDELLCGKTDMGYKAESGADGTFYLNYSNYIKKYQSKLEFTENNGIFCLKETSYSQKYESYVISFIIETDGLSYISIKKDYHRDEAYGDKYLDNHYIHINDKELFEKIIEPIKGIKDWPTLTDTEELSVDELLKKQSKYDHEQLMTDYIASVEPKDQTWTVDKVEDLSTRSYVFKGEELSLICSASGKLVSSQMPNEINLNYSFMIGLDKTVMTTTESAGVTTVKIVADKDDIVKADIDGQIDDLSLDVTLVIQSDMSYTCQYSCYIKYSSNTLSFKQTNVVKENGKIVENYIETETMVSSIKGEINNLMIADSNNNKCKCETTKYEFMGKEPIITILGLIV